MQIVFLDAGVPLLGLRLISIPPFLRRTCCKNSPVPPINVVPVFHFLSTRRIIFFFYSEIWGFVQIFEFSHFCHIGSGTPGYTTSRSLSRLYSLWKRKPRRVEFRHQ